MKMTLFVLSMLVMQIASAQTLREKKIKEDMLQRVDILLEKISEIEIDLEKEDVEEACEKIHQVKELYPDHLLTSGQRLDLHKKRTAKVTNSALDELIFFHQQSLECEQGQQAEYVDSKNLSKHLRKISKSLKKQSRFIRKGDTDNNNSFRYKYDIQY